MTTKTTQQHTKLKKIHSSWTYNEKSHERKSQKEVKGGITARDKYMLRKLERMDEEDKAKQE